MSHHCESCVSVPRPIFYTTITNAIFISCAHILFLSMGPGRLLGVPLAVLAVASPQPPSRGCRVDEDCSLNGVCAHTRTRTGVDSTKQPWPWGGDPVVDAELGQCSCDAAWRGAACDQLALQRCIDVPLSDILTRHILLCTQHTTVSVRC